MGRNYDRALTSNTATLMSNFDQHRIMDLIILPCPCYYFSDIKPILYNYIILPPPQTIQCITVCESPENGSHLVPFSVNANTVGNTHGSIGSQRGLFVKTWFCRWVYSFVTWTYKSGRTVMSRAHCTCILETYHKHIIFNICHDSTTDHNTHNHTYRYLHINIQGRSDIVIYMCVHMRILAATLRTPCLWLSFVAILFLTFTHTL